MEPIPRPDVARVVLTGSESTGKTTLAGQLAQLFRVECVPEFVRTYAERKGAPLSFSDHGPIARGQVALENEYIARAGRLLIQDTDLVSTVVYCEHYFGHCPDFIVEAAVSRRASLYLLLAPDIPWVADGVRDRGDRRDEMHQLFADKLTELGMRAVEISGDVSSRFQSAVSEIEYNLGVIAPG